MADLEALKQALPIEAVVGEYVQLRKAGAAYKGLCPFHQEKTPSFTVSPERGTFRCFGCQKGGDVVAFLMEIEKVDFKEAVRRLGRKAGIDVEIDRPQPVDPEIDEVAALNEAAALFYQGALLSPPGSPALAYLDGRGLTRPTIDRFGLGWAPAGWDRLLQHLIARGHSREALERAGLVVRNPESGRVYDRFRNRLMFPIRDGKGRLVGFGGRELDGSVPKYLNSPQTKLFDKGSVLYLLDAAQETARKAGRVVVVEGYMDALMAHQAGFGSVVASLGTALTDRQLRLLQRTAECVIMALDPDEAGQKAVQQTIRLAQQVSERRRVPDPDGRVASERSPGRYRAQVDLRLFVAGLPGGVDPDELIRANPDAWRAAIDGAKPIVEFFFDRVAQAPGGPAERRERANADLLPIIADLADPLERGHYIDRLATLLELPEAVLVSAVEQLRRRGAAAPLDRGAPRATDGSIHDADAPGGPREGGRVLLGGAWGRQRHLLSLLLRYPRMIAPYREALDGLRPEEPRLAATWDHILAHPEAQTFEDLVAGLGDDDLVTGPYVEALLRESRDLPPLEDVRVRVALDDVVALMREERLRRQIAGYQARLRQAGGEDHQALLHELVHLTREKAAMDYNRRRPGDEGARNEERQ